MPTKPTTRSQDPKPTRPESEAHARIIDGVLVCDADSVRSILFTLQQNLKVDEQLAQRFQDDPGKVLGELGLNRDAQVEVMTSANIDIPEGADCTVTCITTSCHWTIIPVTEEER